MRRIIIFFVLLILTGVVIYLFPVFSKDNFYWILIVLLVFVIEVSLLNSLLNSKRTKKIRWLEERLEAWNTISFNIKRAGDESFNEMPIGILIYDEDYFIKWANGYAGDIFQNKLTDMPLAKINEKIYKALVENEEIKTISVSTKKYDCISKKEHRILYFFDVTEREELRLRYINSRPALVIISLDNLNESLHDFDVSEKSNLRGEYLGEISDFSAKYKAFLQSYDDDALFMVCSYQELEKMIIDKFEVLNKIRDISVKHNLKITASIGIASHDVSMTDLGGLAKNALDLAEKRGGDQVVVNIEGQKIQYFGGKSGALAKNTKIQARVNAQIIKDLVEKASNCLVMAHTSADTDSLGSMIAIYRMIKPSKREIDLVLDMEKVDLSARKIYDELLKKNNSDLVKNVITSDQALSKISEDTLLIVVDTLSPTIVHDKRVLEACSKLVIIDHHRSGEITFLNPLLSYVEPYASSAVEMVVEMFHFYNNNIVIEPDEATIMLSGIIVDTNDFTYRTSFRTFEVASVLREFGADMIKIRRLLREELDKFLEIYRYLNNIEIVLDKFGIIILPDEAMADRIILSKISDVALKIENIDAAFTIGKLSAEKIGISARSYDEINVQLVMEEMGGGGHFNNAACQIEGKTIKEINKILMEILNRDFMEGDKKMKVILLEDIKGRGKKDEIIDVANGYGVFLINDKKAIEASAENLNKLKIEKERRQNEEKMHYELNKKLKEEISGKSINLFIKSGVDGKLFGGINSKMIADEFELQTGIKLDKRKLEIDDSINALGIHTVTVNLYKDIFAQFEVHVISKR